MANCLLIELHYLPPISWFIHALKYESVLIELHENFEKSTYRNRCYIAGPDGKLRLTIPLQHGRNQRTKFSEVKIAYDSDWQKIHWSSLCSCYRNSPYFEYYEDMFEHFYRQRFDLLFTFNLELLKVIIRLLKIDLTIDFTKTFVKETGNSFVDMRSKLLPNHAPEFDHLPGYHQVFQDRTGFLQDLSIVDLLFNEGPNSALFLRPEKSEDLRVKKFL